MITTTNLVGADEWAHSYKNTVLSRDDGRSYNPIRDVINRYVPPRQGDCIEVGCFPGRFLTVFGDMGYKLHGIDTAERVNELPGWLKTYGYNTGVFQCDDFESYEFSRLYDVVCSFGFVEHFTNWEDIYCKHLTLVQDNGYLVMTTPNFRGGVQNVLHRVLDHDNLLKHNLCSMNLHRWAVLAENNGFEVLYCGNVGGFDFWDENQKPNILQGIVGGLLNKVSKYGHGLPDTELYSPYYAIIAKNGDRSY